MKKFIKAFASLATMATMIFAMSAVVSAAEEKMVVPTLYYGNESVAVTKNYSYTNNSRLSSNECGMVIPIEVKEAGTVKFDIKYTRLEKITFAYVYSDAACTNRIGLIGSADVGDTDKQEFLSVTNPGTYYLKFYSYTYSSDTSQYTNSMSITTVQYTIADKTIKSGQTISYYRNNGSDKFYFRYKAEKTGKVTVSLPYEYGSYLTLLNSKKKALSDEEWVSDGVNNSKFTFAVKKGTTYYFLVTTNGTSAGNVQTITVKNSKVKENSGAKKKKAVNIKAKKKIKGTILPGKKASDWYKFKLKKNKKVTINFAGDITGYLKITVYDKSGKSYGSFSSNGAEIKLQPLFGKLKKGTYYIKISRSDSKSSGAYTLKWK